MNKHLTVLLGLLSLCLSTRIAAQGPEKTTYQSIVTDGRTGQTLPFATVRTGDGRGTVANADGAFSVVVGKDDSLTISFIGYATEKVRASDLMHTTQLWPMGEKLEEVTIVSWRPIMRKIVKAVAKRMKERKRDRANFLYRQVTLVDDRATSLVEAFFTARSAVKLCDFRLISGDYTAPADTDVEDSHLSNLYTLSSIGMVNNTKDIVVDEGIVPLTEQYEKYYTVECCADEYDGRRIYVVRLKPKKDFLLKHFEGTLYVDANTFDLIKAEGGMKSVFIRTNYGKKEGKTQPAKVTFTANYGDRGEVVSVAVCASYDDNVKRYTFRSLLFNIGTRDVGEGRKAVPLKDLRMQIEKTGRDMGILDEDEIVKRTALEQELAHTKNDDSYTSSAVDRLKTFVGNIVNFNRMFPQEKVYLHLDNNGYFKGETVWFSAYVIRADFNTPTDMSGVLYVELLNPTGDVIKTCKLKIQDGRAAGSIKLDGIFGSGYYELRAYTRYMLNWDFGQTFSCVIPVFNVPEKESDYSRPVIDTLSRRHQLPNNRVNLAGNDTIEHEGGCLLDVDEMEQGLVKVKVERLPVLHGRKLGFILVNGGNVDAFELIDKDKCALEFRKVEMNEGVNQLAVIDSTGAVLAERLLFVYPHEGIDSIRVSAPTTIVPYGRMALKVRTVPNAHFSISVRDYASEVNGSRLDVATWMFLTSDLDGFVENATYYLESDDAAHLAAVGRLLSKRRRGRYDLATMEGLHSFSPIHPLEDALLLYGKLGAVSTQIPLGGVDLRATLYNQQGQVVKGATTTDSIGRYAFRLPDCEGTWTLLLNTSRDDRAVSYRVGIDRHFSPLPRLLADGELKRLPLKRPLAGVTAKDTAVTLAPLDKRHHLLSEVKVRGRRIFDNARAGWESESRGAYKAMLKYDCSKEADAYADRGMEVPGLLDWLAIKNPFFGGVKDLAEQVSPVSGQQDVTSEVNHDSGRANVGRAETETMGKSHFYVSASMYLEGGGVSYKKRPVIWILDNCFLKVTNTPSGILREDEPVKYVFGENVSQSMELPEWLDEYKSVYISEDPNIWKSFVMIPSLTIYSPVTVFLYSYHTFKVKHEGLRNTYFEGFEKDEKFSANDYSLMAPMEDHRRTLYWNPDVVADKNGEATIEFYNNSTCKQIVVSAEGITNDGKALVY